MKDNDQFDVIIIGAGPAGIECARTLGNSKYSVLLIDKNKVIGTKVCAGGVKDSESIVDIPDFKVKRLKTNYSSLREHSYIFPLGGDEFKCFERVDLGQYQLKRLRKYKNIKVVNPLLVKKIKKDSIETDKGIFKYKYLVGADGSNSLVRSFLGLKSKFCMGLYYNIYPTSEKLKAYYDPYTIKTGYIWEFPHREYNNVGIYFELKQLNPKKAKEYLIEYIKKQGYKYLEKDFYGALINYYYEGHEFGNIFLIGDAGGFTSRLHGGGMSNGMTSGREVGKKILDPEYDYQGLKKIFREMKRDNRMIGLMGRLPVRMFDIIFRFLLFLMSVPILRKWIRII